MMLMLMMSDDRVTLALTLKVLTKLWRWSATWSWLVTCSLHQMPESKPTYTRYALLHDSLSLNCLLPRSRKLCNIRRLFVCLFVCLSVSNFAYYWPELRGDTAKSRKSSACGSCGSENRKTATSPHCSSFITANVHTPRWCHCPSHNIYKWTVCRAFFPQFGLGGGMRSPRALVKFIV